MFLGTSTPRLDEKGRLFLPARFRDDLAGGVVITKGVDGCLFAYSVEEFERRSAALLAHPQTTREARHAARTFFAAAFREVPDRQGRITVPQELRAFAHLERDVVVVGAGNRLEVWDAQTWQQQEAEREAAFTGLTEEVLPGLL